LESAYFNPPLIRTTSQRLDLRSESSYRFERGTDIENVDWASRRGAALMMELAGAKVAAGMVDVYPEPVAEKDLTCRWEKVRGLTGVGADNARIQQAFEALGLRVIETNDASCTLGIPTFRADLEREVDLIEEFARIDGLDKIPTPAPVGRIVPDANDRETQALYTCREHLVGLGLRELVQYTLVPDKLLDLFDPSDQPGRVRLPNPVSQDQAVLRTTLMPQMVESLGRNHARQCRDMAAFELGRVFHLRENEAPEELPRLCIGLMGPAGRLGLDQARAVEPGECFQWIKGIWERLAAMQNVDAHLIEVSTAPYFQEGHGVQIVQDKTPIGVLGLVRPELAAEWRIVEPVAVLEVALAPLLQNANRRAPLRPLTPYPSVSRDMALIVDAAVTHQEILDVIREAAPVDLEHVQLFDIFTGQNVGSGRKSMAYSLTYRSAERTLTDAGANEYHERVKEALRQRLSVEFRDR
jgi:phenylalanyl-tRNA synthetase beta chain